MKIVKIQNKKKVKKKKIQSTIREYFNSLTKHKAELIVD